jgi:hypothetical protein
MVDVRRYLLRAEVADAAALEELARAGLVGDFVSLDVECAITGNGSVKASEVAAVIAGDGVTAPPHRAVRVALFGIDDAGRFSPLEGGRGRQVGEPQGAGGGAVHPHELGALAVAAGGGGAAVGRPTAEGSVCPE